MEASSNSTNGRAENHLITLAIPPTKDFAEFITLAGATSGNTDITTRQAAADECCWALGTTVPRRADEKITVQVQVVFLKIGEIDTVKEQYSADIYIQSRWREPKLDNKSPDQLKSADLSKLWSPQLYIENALSEARDSNIIYKTASALHDGESIRGRGGEQAAYVLEKRKLRGVFYESLELQNFPFDVQDLSITVASEHPEADVELAADDKDESCVNILTFADGQEWKLYEHIEVTKKTVAVDFEKKHGQRSAIQVKCRAARRPGYFYYNVFLIMFLICSMVFGSFAVDSTLVQNRLQLSFTLLLTSIAFKMAINQSLPKISYLTYMDKYILLSIVFLVLVSIWHSIVSSIVDLDNKGEASSFYATKNERYVLFAFIVLFAIGNILFAAFVYVNAWKRRREMAKKDREFRMLRSAPESS